MEDKKQKAASKVLSEIIAMLEDREVEDYKSRASKFQDESPDEEETEAEELSESPEDEESEEETPEEKIKRLTSKLK